MNTSRPRLGPADHCEPTIRRTPFSDADWLFELKHDGFRAFVRTKPIQILTRRGNSLTEAFPEVVAAVAALKLSAVLDGELVVPNGEGLWPLAMVRLRTASGPLQTIQSQPKSGNDGGKGGI